MSKPYGEAFRDAYSVLHGGRPEEPGEDSGRAPGESLEEYLARSRAEARGAARRRLLAFDVPAGAETVHRLLLDLLEVSAHADEALARQVAAYGCGDYAGSIARSEDLAALIAESVRLDRELIMALASLPARLRNELGIG